jgi:hypothetical protein
MVRKAEAYPHSSQRAYLGMKEVGAVDIDPVLRLFGARKKQARENFAQYVIAGMKLGHREEFYFTDEAGILGIEEFVDATIHRLGETDGRTRRYSKKEIPQFNADALITAVEQVCQNAERGFLRPRQSDAGIIGEGSFDHFRSASRCKLRHAEQHNRTKLIDHKQKV